MFGCRFTCTLGLFASLSSYAAPRDAWRPTLRDCPLPPELQERFETARGDVPDARLVDWLTDYRRQHPRLYGPTLAPPSGVSLVPDHAPMRRLHVALPGWEDHDDTYVTLLAAAADHGLVRASVFWPADVPRIRRQLKERGANVSAIEFVYADPVETIWMRDYGPVPVTTSAGPGLVDFGFAPDCVENDAYPTRSAPPQRPIWRSELLVEGGNLMTDGRGTCFSTTALLTSSGRSELELTAELRQWVGCERLLLLEPLTGSAAPHIDLFLTPAPNDLLLVAAVDPKEDPVNHAVMQRNRDRLAQAAGPWTLVDLPMPPPALDAEGSLVRRSWNNLVPFNGVVLVPDYSGVPAVRVTEAWRRIAAAFPGRELRAIPSDRPIEHGGSIHCLTRAEP